MAIYDLWVALFKSTAKCLLLSQGQAEAYELLNKVKFVYDKLPQYLKPAVDNFNRELFTLKDSYAEIRALPSTEKAGHGYQASVVVRDELARHDNARENFKAVSRAVDSGGKLIELSTANKSDPTNYFMEKTSEFYHHPDTTVKVLPSGLELYTNPARPNTCMVFLSWKLRPVRYEGLTLEEWWQSRILPKYTAQEIEEQYPSVITDVFKPSITKSYFDFPTLEDMGYDICPPIRESGLDTFSGIVRVYKPPLQGRRYVLFTDPSDGVEDPFVTGVMDYITGEVICTASSKVKVDFVAKIHDYLVRQYNNATNSYEYTGSAGGAFAMCLDMLKTPNQAVRRKVDGKVDPDKHGQYVSGDHKKKILGDLAFAIAKRQIIVHDREFTQQAKLVTRDGDAPVTERKLHFDWVMMMAGLNQLKKFTPHAQTQVRSYPYLRGR